MKLSRRTCRGGDSKKWRRPLALIKLASYVCYPRPTDLAVFGKNVENFLPFHSPHISRCNRYSQTRQQHTDEDRPSLYEGLTTSGASNILSFFLASSGGEADEERRLSFRL